MVNPYVLMTLLYLFVAVLAALDASLVSLNLLSWFNGVRWLRVHFITLGMLTQVLFVALPVLVATRRRLPRPALRWDIWLTLNVGLRKLMGIGPAAGRRGIISVLERVPLDQKRTLYVVKAGDEVLLLGASDLSVNFLSKLDAKAVEEAAKPAGQVTLSPFLQKLLGKKDVPPPPPAT